MTGTYFFIHYTFFVSFQVNALLPTETFIPVIRSLMANKLPSVRRKAMDLLNNKLQQRTQWQKTQVTHTSYYLFYWLFAF